MYFDAFASLNNVYDCRAFKLTASRLVFNPMGIDCDRDDLIELLAWYGELGVDCTLDEEGVDWLQHGNVAPGSVIRQALREAPNGRSQSDKRGEKSDARYSAGHRGVAPSADHAERGAKQRAPIDSTVNRGLAETSRAGKQPAAAVSSRSGTTAPVSSAVAGARRIAAAAKSLDELRRGLEEFEGCALRATAKNTCFYRGAETARLMVIGEAPGRDEDQVGKPFVGRAGKLLDLMLDAIGLSEKDVHITNVVYWRPPGNRTPTLQETESCRPFLERQVQLVEPEFILLAGGASAKTILETSDGIMRLRGKWKDITFGGRDVRVMPTLHPAYLLRTPAAKRQAWRDLLLLKKSLDA